GLLSALAIAVFVWRRRDPPWMTLWLGLYPVFIMTTPQINYFNMRLLPLLFHVALLVGPAAKADGGEEDGGGGLDNDLRGHWHLWPLLWLFAVEAVTQWSMVERMPRYTVTSLTSVGLTVYLAFMAWALGRAAFPRKAPT